MRHAFLLLLLVLLVGSSAQAQTPLGLRLGGSLTHVQAVNNAGSVVYTTSGAELGGQLGLTYQWLLTKRLSVVPELQFSRERLLLTQGTALTGDFSFTDAYHTRLDYLNLPVLARLTWGKLYLEAGPQLSLLLAGRQTGTQTTTVWTAGYQTYVKDIDRSVSNDYRRVDAGACLGAGLQLPAGLGLSVRLYQSLLPLARDPATTHDELHRQAWQFSLTYELAKRS